MTNDDLSRLVDTSDTWKSIRERTGIEQRHIADEGELTSDLEIAASRQALVRRASTPSILISWSAPRRHRTARSRPRACASGRCQGRGLRRAGGGARASSTPWPSPTISSRPDNSSAPSSWCGNLLGAFSIGRRLRAVRRRRRRGRAGGAVRSSAAATTAASSPPASAQTGRFEELLYVDGGPGSTKTTGHLRMNGREVFRHAVQKISGVIEETLVMSGYAPDEVDLYVHIRPTSASSTASPIACISREKIVFTLAKHRRHVGGLDPRLPSIRPSRTTAWPEHFPCGGHGRRPTWGAALARW